MPLHGCTTVNVQMCIPVGVVFPFQEQLLSAAPAHAALLTKLICPAGPLAVRMSYPEGMWTEHAKVHAAACASTFGDIARVWAGSARSGRPYVGLQLRSVAATAKLLALQLPSVQGRLVDVVPWKGAMITNVPVERGNSLSDMVLLVAVGLCLCQRVME